MLSFRELIKEKIFNNLIKFLKQGTSPQKLALGISIGVVVGVFPILGTHTALTLLVIYLLKLNPASIFLITNIVFPLFFVFVIPFIRFGEIICNAEKVAISISSVYNMMDLGILYTLQTLGMTLVYAFVGWAIFSIPVGLALYFLSIRPLMNLGMIAQKKYGNTTIKD
ncbi:MAG: DUF2062 domain-containing protein [Cytophagales bacterium]